MPARATPKVDPLPAISRLMPSNGSPKDTNARARAVRRVVGEVAMEAIALRPGCDVLAEVYLAGLWHGAELQRHHKGELGRADQG